MTSEIINYLGDTLAYNVFIYSLMTCFSSVIITLYVITRLQRVNAYKRPFKLWSFFTKIFAFYSLIVVGGIGLVIGVVMGCNTTINELVELGVEVSMNDFVLLDDGWTSSIISFLATDYIDGRLAPLYTTIVSTGVLLFLKVPLLEMIFSNIILRLLNWNPSSRIVNASAA